MRKGKEYCPYVGWRKERVEEVVTNKLRTTLLRLSLDNHLEEEIRMYHNEKNKHVIAQASSWRRRLRSWRNVWMPLKTIYRWVRVRRSIRRCLMRCRRN